MNPHTSASLLIYGYDNVSELANLLGVQPNEAFAQGESVRPGAEPLDRSYCAFHSQIDSEFPEEHIQKILDMFNATSQNVKQLSESCEVILAVKINSFEYNSEMMLENDMLVGITALGVKLWVDSYFFKENYLESRQQAGMLHDRLSQVAELGSESGDKADYITELVEATAEIESASTDLSELITDMVTEDLDDEELTDALAEIKEGLARITEAKQRSLYYSSEA